MQKYIPGEVYKNIQKLLEYRGITTNYNFMTTDKFSQYLTQFEYVKIEGRREFADGRRPAINAYIIMIAPDSDYALTTMKFRKLCPGVVPESDLKGPVEIMFISERELTSNILRAVQKLRQDYPSAYI